MDFKEIKREHMEKAVQYIQSEDIRNVSIFLNWNDICNADMNELAVIL